MFHLGLNTQEDARYTDKKFMRKSVSPFIMLDATPSTKVNDRNGILIRVPIDGPSSILTMKNNNESTKGHKNRRNELNVACLMSTSVKSTDIDDYTNKANEKKMFQQRK